MLVTVYHKVNNGQPSTSVTARIRQYNDLSMTWATLWGCIAATVRYAGTLDEAFQVADQWLGNAIEITDDDGDLLWNGLVWSVKFGTGARARKRSLDGYANTTRVIYNGNFTGQVDDPDGLRTYGRIVSVETNTQLDVTQANARRARILAERSRLLYAPESGGGRDTIELGLVGWYRTLFYRPYTSATAGSADVGAVVQAILGACGQFLSSDYSQVPTSTGATAPQTYDKFEMGGDIIKRTVGLIPTPWTFGIGLDRVPYLRASNRLATSPTYIERGNGTITDISGGRIDPWDVRPDAVLRQADFVPATLSPTVALDDVANVYLAETTYSTERGLSYKAAIAGINGAISAS